WERVAQGKDIEGNFVGSERFHPAPVPADAEANGDGTDATAASAVGAGLPPGRSEGRDATRINQLFGDAWEWTRSAYSPYPGYRAGPGALGEYNGKFMCNQYVLRGGSCATSQSHIRVTYRNFFQPEKRWQFTGIRLARDAA